VRSSSVRVCSRSRYVTNSACVPDAVQHGAPGMALDLSLTSRAPWCTADPGPPRAPLQHRARGGPVSAAHHYAALRAASCCAAHGTRDADRFLIRVSKVPLPAPQVLLLHRLETRTLRVSIKFAARVQRRRITAILRRRQSPGPGNWARSGISSRYGRSIAHDPSGRSAAWARQAESRRGLGDRRARRCHIPP
jgi:hypothetical protein